MAAGTLDTQHWKRLDALLEEALSLPAAERARWLESLDPAQAHFFDTASEESLGVRL